MENWDKIAKVKYEKIQIFPKWERKDVNKENIRFPISVLQSALLCPDIFRLNRWLSQVKKTRHENQRCSVQIFSKIEQMARKKNIYNKENISQVRKEEKNHEKKNKRSEKKDHQDKKRIEREDIV